MSIFLLGDFWQYYQQSYRLHTSERPSFTKKQRTSFSRGSSSSVVNFVNSMISILEKDLMRLR